MQIYSWDHEEQLWDKSFGYLKTIANNEGCKCGFNEKYRKILDSIPDNLMEILENIRKRLDDLRKKINDNNLKITNLENKLIALENKLKDLQDLLTDILDKIKELDDAYKIPVTSITLNYTSATVIEGHTLQLSATVKPDDAYNKMVDWSSGNNSIATVNTSGLVTGVKPGNCIITCTAKDGSGITTICNLTVISSIILVSSITLNQTNITLIEGETYSLIPTINPNDATDKSVTWSSNNTPIATVSSSGVVNAVKAGTCVVTCMAKDGSNKYAICNVTVVAKVINVTGLSINPTSRTINVGESFFITPTISPSNATNKSVTWSSSNHNIAISYSSGQVSGYSAGSCIITCTTQDGNKTATCSVYVNTPNIPVTGLSINPTSRTINVNETFYITATVTPSNATNKSVTWSSSNTTIASINSSGMVTGRSAGSCIITCTTQDGYRTATCSVYVNTPTINVSGISVSPSSATKNTGNTFYVYATITPSNATNKSVTWSSSNTGIATVDSYGYVICRSVGTCNITARSNNGYSDYCILTVKSSEILTTSLTINEKTYFVGNSYSSPHRFTLGYSEQFTVTKTPSNSTQAITWSSSGSGLSVSPSAVGSQYGLVSATSTGNYTVTARSGSASDTIYVQVVPRITGITVSPSSTTVANGGTVTIIVRPVPSGACISGIVSMVGNSNSNHEPIIENSGPDVVTTPGQSAVFTYRAYRPGTATITYSTSYYGHMMSDVKGYATVRVT